MRESEVLSLGTANWGGTYGILNRQAPPDLGDLSSILDLARNKGVCYLDTAVDYGFAEAILGKVGVSDFVVTTKLPAVPWEVDDVQSWFHQQVEGSLDRLQVAKLGCVLLHRPEQLTTMRGDPITEALLDLKRSKLVEKVGISIYEPDILASISDAGILTQIDVVQAPMNAFDRRLVDSGWSSRLSESGIEIEARSVFLQGLLTTPISALPPQLSYFSESLTPWWTHINERGESPVSEAVNAVSQLGVASRIIVGAQNLSQFNEIIMAFKVISKQRLPNFEAPLTLIDPRQWPPRKP